MGSGRQELFKVNVCLHANLVAMIFVGEGAGQG